MLQVVACAINAACTHAAPTRVQICRSLIFFVFNHVFAIRSFTKDNSYITESRREETGP
jgi:hypothetical protein